jgi:hypothetical protein
MQISPGDMIAIAQAAQDLDVSPVGLAGRALGLTPGEQEQIPNWTWYALAFMGGAAAGGWLIPRAWEWAAR